MHFGKGSNTLLEATGRRERKRGLPTLLWKTGVGVDLTTSESSERLSKRKYGESYINYSTLLASIKLMQYGLASPTQLQIKSLILIRLSSVQ